MKAWLPSSSPRLSTCVGADKGARRWSSFSKFFISHIDISDMSWLRGARGPTFYRLGGVTSKTRRNPAVAS